MPAPPQENEDPGSISPGQLRRLLHKTLCTDSQLEAFCIDYFPQVHREFSGGMDRTGKLNLLLLHAPPTVVLRRLRHYAQEVVEREQLKQNPNRVDGMPRSSARKRYWVLASLVGACALAVVFNGHRGWRREQTGTTGPPAAIAAAQIATVSGSEQRNQREQSTVSQQPAPWLTSDPTGALVVDAETGRELGQTPWTPDSSTSVGATPTRSMRVCLRQAGFVPIGVKLGPEAEAIRTQHVKLRRDLGAVLQRNHGQEKCNAPTTIIR